MRIAFLGTPEFALPSLNALFLRGDELAVFTQPDRPVGRHAVLTPPSVKAFALERGVPVYQFEKIRAAEGVAALKAFAPELMVTAAYGQLLSAENLSIPTHGCVNVHGSLLPKYRGAAPIQWAIIDGETETGITTMLTDVGMDTGDVLLFDKTPIDPNETAGELSARLSEMGAGTLIRTLAQFERDGSFTRIRQDDARATKCPMLKKEHGKLDFTRSAKAVHDRVRGTNPWPGAYAFLDGEPVKIWKTARTNEPCLNAPCGLLRGDKKTGLFVGCEDEWLEIVELQAAGGKRMDAKTLLLGKVMEGKVLS